MQQKNFLLFFILSFVLFVAWESMRRQFAPPRPNKQVQEKVEQSQPPPPPLASKARALQLALGPVASMVKGVVPPPVKPVPPPSAPPITAWDKVANLMLGSDSPTSKFHLMVVCDSRGASVRSVTLNKFQQTNLHDDLCEPLWKKDKDGNLLLDDQGRRIPVPLELVPGHANLENPSNLLFLYDPQNPADARPLDTLAKRVWDVVPEEKNNDQGDEGSKNRTRLTFRTELAELGLTLTKTYTLAEGEYHIGLEVNIALSKGARHDRNIRYQLTGAHALPIEGKWYTNTFRNALIAEEEKGQIWRDFQDLRQIDLWAGGNEVKRQANRMIRYAGVAVQYFASVVVVDNNQSQQNFLEYARPTLETSVTRGTVRSIDPENHRFVLLTNDPHEREQTFFVLDDFELERIRPDTRISVLHYTDSKLRKIAVKLAGEFSQQPLWEDDITVRVVTEPHKLAPGESLTHRYLLYNGPVKPSLLRQQTGDARVSEAVIDRYVNTLHLNTLTDYHSPGWLGTFASTIYWTNLVIHCTNLMHWILGGLHTWVPSYGLCIILLTVMVRGLMFPLSRKQALMGMKMQALGPEMKAMHEKFKDDKQGLVQAQMELYRKHKINPFGTCWLLILQMPVFMGLYFAFQESIYFRLAPFWPTWIINLAAPDMLWHWGHNIPWISRPEDYGSMVYLGPCLNLLPVIAVALMMVQQKMMTPPPADEQQEMQQKVMKYMMIFMGLMFYKVAAGLCVYFVASSLWGFAERKLLPKFSHSGASPAADSAVRESAAPASTAFTTAASMARAPLGVSDGKNRRNKQARNKKKERGGRAEAGDGKGRNEDEDSKSALGRLGTWIRKRRQRLHDWWTEVLKQAEKK